METSSVEFPVRQEKPAPNRVSPLAFPLSFQLHTHTRILQPDAAAIREESCATKFPRYMTRTTCSSITLENCHIIIDISTSQLKLRWQVKDKFELPLETSAV